MREWRDIYRQLADTMRERGGAPLTADTKREPDYNAIHRSILTGLIPLQDLLNKAVADLVTAMEDNALPARFGTGIQAKFDPVTGEETPVWRRAKRR